MKSNSELSLAKVVAKALCKFPDGETRNLAATRFSSTEMFIVCMRPPPIGTKISVVLHPNDLYPLPEVVALVTTTLINPANARTNGFGANITTTDKNVIEAFKTALVSDDSLSGNENVPSEDTERPQLERRVDPRVLTDFEILLETAKSSYKTRAVNLSMSGAMLNFGEAGLPEDVIPGSRIQLDVIDKRKPEYFSLKADVVRLININGALTGIGVKFYDLDPLIASRIEGIILHEIYNFDENPFN